MPALMELGHRTTFAITTTKWEWEWGVRDRMYEDENWWHKQR
jgi:hypothetical protein